MGEGDLLYCGVDLSWMPYNPSGVVILRYVGGKIFLEEARTYANHYGVFDYFSSLLGKSNKVTFAVDAPFLQKKKGFRKLDHECAKFLRRFGLMLLPPIVFDFSLFRKFLKEFSLYPYPKNLYQEMGVFETYPQLVSLLLTGKKIFKKKEFFKEPLYFDLEKYVFLYFRDYPTLDEFSKRLKNTHEIDAFLCALVPLLIHNGFPFVTFPLRILDKKPFIVSPMSFIIKNQLCP